MGLFDFILFLKRRKIKSFLQRDAILLDVREAEELKANKIARAVHVPLSQLNEASKSLKEQESPIIVFCARGVRAAKAVEILKLKNMEAVNGGSIEHLKKML